MSNDNTSPKKLSGQTTSVEGLDDADCSPSFLPIPERVPHPWKDGEHRLVFTIPIKRHIILTIDEATPAGEIERLAERMQREFGLNITGSGFTAKMSPFLENNQDR